MGIDKDKGPKTFANKKLPRIRTACLMGFIQLWIG